MEEANTEEAKSNICVVNLGLRRALSTTGRVIHGPGGSLRWSTSTTTCLASAGADEKATPASSISAGGEDKSREWMEMDCGDPREAA